jgi:hypothetical protein
MAQSQTTKTTDHDEIRRWAQEHGGRPARVRGTGADGSFHARQRRAEIPVPDPEPPWPEPEPPDPNPKPN